MLNRIKKRLKKIGKSESCDAQKQLQFPGIVKEIKDTNEEDVFVIGFPKSGNTLMQHIITHLVYGINENCSRTLVNLVVPDVYANSHYFRINDRCFFKSHELPAKKFRKVIYLIRDGREAMLSYHHMLRNTGNDISISALFKEEVLPMGFTWRHHIETWERNEFNADVLWVKYEDLVSDKLNCLKKIAAFLNINKTEAEFKQVVELTSFKHMKSMEARTDWVAMKKESFLSNKSFVRSGKLSSFKKEVDPNLVDEFENKSKKVLAKYYDKKVQ